MPPTTTPAGETSVRALLRQGQQALGAAPESVLDAELLLAAVTGRDRSALLAHPEAVVETAAIERYQALIARRAGGEPVAYLLGTRGFWTLDLAVGPGVLVPRPETELLVELALERLAGREDSPRTLDLGTGSGAVALALASERPDAEHTATEVSDVAFGYARRNADANGLEVELLLSDPADWYLTVSGRRFDLIVSNPPYVAAGDPALEAQVAAHEPEEALISGADGLDALRAIVAGASAHLEAGGAMLLEHGHDQGAVVRALLEEAGFSAVTTHRDLSGHARVTVGELAAEDLAGP